MQIKKQVKTEDGVYEVNADFSEEEMTVIIDVGLNTLLNAGALPFIEKENKTYTVVPPSDLTQ